MSAAVRADLERAGRESTALGALALHLAWCIDGAPMTGSALAAVVKQLLAAMDNALAGAFPPRGRLAELHVARETAMSEIVTPLIKSQAVGVLPGDAQVQMVPAKHDLSKRRADWCRWIIHEP